MTGKSNQRMWVVISIVLMAFLSPATAKVIYVDANAPGPTHDGSSWKNAYKHIQDALADAGSAAKPVEIQVAQGAYKPDQSSADPNGSGNRTATFQLINSVTLKGGYAGFGELDPNKRDIEAYETILSGDLKSDDIGNFLDPSRGENSYHIVTSIGTDQTSILDGFIIYHSCSQDSYPNDRGGGINNESGSLKVIQCTFQGNIAKRGAGMYNKYGNPILINSSFIENAATSSGGGMYNYKSRPTLTNCIFRENFGHYDSGGIYTYDSKSTLKNCTFIENSAGMDGGGIENSHSRLTLTGCVFKGNHSVEGGTMYNYETNLIVEGCEFDGNYGSRGAGLYNTYDCNIILIDCSFQKNSAVDGGVIYDEKSNLSLRNCKFIANSAIDSGGVMYNYYNISLLINCAFIGGKGYKGGAIFSYSSVARLNNCTFFGNQSYNGKTLVCDSYQHSYPENLEIINSILWDGDNSILNIDNSSIVISYSNFKSGWTGIGNIDTDPCFAEPGYWADENDPNIPVEPNDPNAVWIDGDYHLKSQAGRWDPNSQSWVRDDVTSPCIDAGNPGCPEANEPSPNGNRRNMGAYGGTAEASKSPPYWRSIADTTNDWIVDSNDLKVFVGYWLQTGECIPSDLDRSRFVDSNDFAIFAGQWRQKGPGPGITYDIGACIPVDFPSSAVVEFEPTRFTVTVEGQYILFEDMMRANCCPEELDVQMTVEGDLITIYEIERFFTRVPCPCMCDFPITATFGPFEPGTYIFAVYQNEGFIGSTTVTIGPTQ